MKRFVVLLCLILLFLITLLYDRPAWGQTNNSYGRTFSKTMFIHSTNSDSILFQDDFETDKGWPKFEEPVDSCAAIGIGEVARSTEEKRSGIYSLGVWANKADSINSNHVFGHHKLYDHGVIGRYVYSLYAFIPMTSDTGQTGPEFSVQNTRKVFGRNLTYIAGIQFISNPHIDGGKSWNIWHNGKWEPLLYKQLSKGIWYHFDLEFDYSCNRYISFKIRGADIDTTIDLTLPTTAAPEGYEIGTNVKDGFQPALELTLEAQNLETCSSNTRRRTQYKVFYDDVQLRKRAVDSFQDDFESNHLDLAKWDVRDNGVPYFENGALILTSNFSDSVKTPIQSDSNFHYGRLDIAALSSHWKSDLSDSTIDTSIGLEIFYNGCHDGIVVTNGTLGILKSIPDSNGNCSDDPPFQSYLKIPKWDSLKTSPNKYTILWQENKIDLLINGNVVISHDSIPPEFVPKRPMKIRLNCNVDLNPNFNKKIMEDTLSVDYVCYDTTFTIWVGISSNESSGPREFSLSQNFPNPFNPETIINYQIPKRAKVDISIYNILGQKVRTLVDEERMGGTYVVKWDGKDQIGRHVPSGIYIYRINAEEFVQAKKMIFLR